MHRLGMKEALLVLTDAHACSDICWVTKCMNRQSLIRILNASNVLVVLKEMRSKGLSNLFIAHADFHRLSQKEMSSRVPGDWCRREVHVPL